MKIFELKEITGDGFGYDYADHMIIIANSEEEARSLASKEYTGGDSWLNDSKTSCTELKPDSVRVVIQHINYG